MDHPYKNIKAVKLWVLFGVISLSLSSCKVDDPWVNAEIAPVLVDIVGAPFGYPQEKEPTVAYAISSGNSLTLKARLLELNKSGLNSSTGIDSIPVSGVPVTVSLRTGAALGSGTTGADGSVSLNVTWSALGLTNPVANNLVKISWTGTYKGVSFTRYSQVQAK